MMMRKESQSSVRRRKLEKGRKLPEELSRYVYICMQQGLSYLPTYLDI